MAVTVYTASLQGIDGEMVRVETELSRGLPGFYIVGLAGAAIRESHLRIRAALEQNGIGFPSRKITVNLSPAWQRKEGSHFDLPIALGIAAEGRGLGQDQDKLEKTAFFGELSLNGKLAPIRGALPLVLCAVENGFRRVVLPRENRGEVSLVRGADIFACSSLEQVLALMEADFQGPLARQCQMVEPKKEDEEEIPWAKGKQGPSARGKQGPSASSLDYREVLGHSEAKRALVISAAGGHGLLMVGNPGCGKSMLAARLVTILPPMDYREQVEVTQIYSVAGLLDEKPPFVRQRPFRSPHHTVSRAALLGGGGIPRPGEFSLAHHGVLFLDELGEFDQHLLDDLRQPLEEHKVTLARIGGAAVYPGEVLLLAASNPCRCGHYGDPQHLCTCSSGDILRYRRKLAGPFLDRIDMHMQIPAAVYGQQEVTMDSSTMRQQVMIARQQQERRFEGTSLFFNARIPAAALERYCPMTPGAKSLLEAAGLRLGLSMRGSHKCIKLARTIADLQEKQVIEEEHMAEALGYREKE